MTEKSGETKGFATREQSSRPKAEELKIRAEQIAAQTGFATEEAVKEFKEEVEKESKSKRVIKQIVADTLVPVDLYLASGIHIGTQRKIKAMKKFIFKVRSDGLAVLDIATIDKRIRTVANFLTKFAPERVMVVSGRDTGKKPVQKFCEVTGCRPVVTRFMPGSLTNPSFPNYREPDLIFVVDPGVDRQAIMEALRMNIPIVALCDTNNLPQNLDVVLPVNNKGKKSLALVFWLLAREFLKIKGKISSDDEFTFKVEDFEATDAKEEPEKKRKVIKF